MGFLVRSLPGPLDPLLESLVGGSTDIPRVVGVKSQQAGVAGALGGLVGITSDPDGRLGAAVAEHETAVAAVVPSKERPEGEVAEVADRGVPVRLPIGLRYHWRRTPAIGGWWSAFE